MSSSSLSVSVSVSVSLSPSSPTFVLKSGRSLLRVFLTKNGLQVRACTDFALFPRDLTRGKRANKSDKEKEKKRKKQKTKTTEKTTVEHAIAA